MSRVDELIQELCPDGVERVALGEVAKYVRGLTYKKENEVSEGGVAVLRANNITLGSNQLNFDDLKRVSGDLKISRDKILGTGDTLICAGSGSKEHVGKVAFSDKDTNYAFGGFMAVIRPKDLSLNPRFLFHNLSSKDFRDYLEGVLSTSTINNLNARIADAFPIPLPPLEVQEEIVRILDQFVELDRELEQEIPARERQKFAMGSALFDRLNSYPRLSLRDAGTWFGGGTPSKSNDSFWKNGTIPWVSPKDMQGHSVTRTIDYITEEAVEESSTKLIPPGATALVTRSSILDKRLPIAFFPQTVTMNQDLKAVLPNEEVNGRYLFNALEQHREGILRLAHKKGGSAASLDTNRLMSFEIPLPPLEFQEEIAAKLDTFTEYIDNLKRERELRQKQYEYYRDRLLDFKLKE